MTTITTRTAPNTCCVSAAHSFSVSSVVGTISPVSGSPRTFNAVLLFGSGVSLQTGTETHAMQDTVSDYDHSPGYFASTFVSHLFVRLF